MTAPPGDLAKIRANCRDRLRVVEKELTRCYYHQQVWTDIREAITKRFPNADGTFINSYSQMYGTGQAMAIRRLVDHDEKPWSLWRLYDMVRRNPQLLSRADYVEASGTHFGDPGTWQYEAGRERAADGFTSSMGSGPYADPAIIAEYQQRMTSSAAKVKEFVDQRIAHLDPGGMMLDITFDQIHASLDYLADAANRIQVLLDGSTVMYSHATIVGDWREPLRASFFPMTPGHTWGAGVSFS